MQLLGEERQGDAVLRLIPLLLCMTQYNHNKAFQLFAECAKQDSWYQPFVPPFVQPVGVKQKLDCDSACSHAVGLS